MPGEEEPVLDAFEVARKQFSDLKLVMAPRHPERCGEVEALLLRRGFRFVKRTALTLPSPGAGEGLILDTIGELAGLFQFATVVFVGGSLVPRGGHNVLEPARYAKPIIFGPHMYNFRDISRVFLAAGAAIQIQNSSDLAASVAKVLSDARFAADLGRKARRIVDENVGATERVLQVVEGL
jgi:3-deoxy-D-manno-octulosonic-acid transferase